MGVQMKSPMTEEWFPELYRQKVRSQRTRRCVIDVPSKENEPRIQHTLLGIELKVGRRRISCPDLPTARYMRVFAKIGCKEFAIPYDITKISAISTAIVTRYSVSILMVCPRLGVQKVAERTNEDTP